MPVCKCAQGWDQAGPESLENSVRDAIPSWSTVTLSSGQVRLTMSLVTSSCLVLFRRGHTGKKVGCETKVSVHNVINIMHTSDRQSKPRREQRNQGHVSISDYNFIKNLLRHGALFTPEKYAFDALHQSLLAGRGEDANKGT